MACAAVKLTRMMGAQIRRAADWLPLEGGGAVNSLPFKGRVRVGMGLS